MFRALWFDPSGRATGYLNTMLSRRAITSWSVEARSWRAGDVLLHYNRPFADLYMEVRPDSRRKGYGSFLLQEVKKACYLASRVPAARCGIGNHASRPTLLKAGMRLCGFMLKGQCKIGA